jgi:hypothetical protein
MVILKVQFYLIFMEPVIHPTKKKIEYNSVVFNFDSFGNGRLLKIDLKPFFFNFNKNKLSNHII